MYHITDSSSSSSSNKLAFFKRTRKGKVIKLIKEKYLRTDLQCGFIHSSILSIKDLHNLVQENSKKHICIVDTNICLHEIDVLEYRSPDPLIIVILQTVLQEVKNLNLSVYKRLSVLLADETRFFIFYPNEVSSMTVADRSVGESANDFNDRRIRVASIHYQDIIGKDKGCKVVLLTHDKKNKAEAQSAGLTANSMMEYVQNHMSACTELLDLVSFVQGDGTSKESGSGNPDNDLISFPPHLTASEITTRLRARTLLKGVLRCERGDYSQCYVIIHSNSDGDSFRQSLVISGNMNVNRATDGDLVAVEIIESTSRPQQVVPAVSSHAFDSLVGVGNVEVSGEIQEATEDCIELLDVLGSSDASFTPTQGRVVGILRRNWRQFAGSVIDVQDYLALPSVSRDASADQNNLVKAALEVVMKNNSKKGGVTMTDSEASAMLFIPVEKKLPPVLLQTRRRNDLLGQRVLVSIDDWPAQSVFPLGHYVSTLGADGDKQVETQVLLHEFGVSHESFSAEVMACLPPLDWKITPNIIAQRTDLRHLPIVSIDPPGCKDIDDALHCIQLPNGNLQVGVHIADVSYFVHPDTAIDKEAAHRSTSTYLVERRLDMLPGLLTTDICSLRGNEDHLTFSVLWEMDINAQIVDVSFCKSVIHSAASLTYDQAQVMLDNRSLSVSDIIARPIPPQTAAGSVVSHSDDALCCSVKLLNHIAHILRSKRIEAGALTLASPEVRFKLDSETQNPTDVSMYALKEANALVEEFMLLANITVAKQTLRHFPTLSVLRRHQPPSHLQFESFLQLARTVGVDIDISSSKTLADSLDAAVNPDDPYFNKLLRILSTRCMKPAQYFCSGEIPKELWHHYGLAAPVYTHFTSPIRRYADIIVHRLLAASIGVIALPSANADRSRQQDRCSHMNRRHKAAQYVQRASVNLHTVMFFKQRGCSSEQAYVLSLTPEKLVVFVPKFALEGTISVSQIAAELSGVISYDDATLCLSILRPKSDQSECLLSLRVFQQITVLLQVVETISGHRQLDMQLDYNNISATIITISNLGSDNMLISSSSKLAISVSEEEGKAAATDFLPFRNDSEDVDVVDAEGDVRAQQSPSSAKRQKLTSSANSESSYSGGKKGFVSLYKNRNISPPLKIAPLRKSKKKI